jgi:hypothetical protein
MSYSLVAYWANGGYRMGLYVVVLVDIGKQIEESRVSMLWSYLCIPCLIGLPHRLSNNYMPGLVKCLLAKTFNHLIIQP